MIDQVAEQELVDRLRSRDHSAVEALESAYGSQIYRLAVRYLKNHEDAEEVTQDVLFQVSRKIDGFRRDAALSSWIYRITFNAAMSRLRNTKFSPPFEVPHRDGADLFESSVGHPGRELADWSPLADEAVLRSQMRRRFVDALVELQPIYQLPVLLRDVQGLSTEEASAVLQVKRQTLKSRLHRGRLVLRERLAQFADGLTMHRPAETCVVTRA